MSEKSSYANAASAWGKKWEGGEVQGEKHIADVACLTRETHAPREPYAPRFQIEYSLSASLRGHSLQQ